MVDMLDLFVILQLMLYSAIPPAVLFLIRYQKGETWTFAAAISLLSVIPCALFFMALSMILDQLP